MYQEILLGYIVLSTVDRDSPKSHCVWETVRVAHLVWETSSSYVWCHTATERTYRYQYHTVLYLLEFITVSVGIVLHTAMFNVLFRGHDVWYKKIGLAGSEDNK